MCILLPMRPAIKRVEHNYPQCKKRPTAHIKVLIYSLREGCFLLLWVTRISLYKVTLSGHLYIIESEQNVTTIVSIRIVTIAIAIHIPEIVVVRQIR